MVMKRIIVSIFLTSMMFTSLFSQEQATPKKFLGEIQVGAILIHNGMMSGILPEASVRSFERISSADLREINSFISFGFGFGM